MRFYNELIKKYSKEHKKSIYKIVKQILKRIEHDYRKGKSSIVLHDISLELEKELIPHLKGFQILRYKDCLIVGF